MSASRIPDIDAFEERAAIAEYDGGLTRLQNIFTTPLRICVISELKTLI